MKMLNEFYPFPTDNHFRHHFISRNELQPPLPKVLVDNVPYCDVNSFLIQTRYMTRITGIIREFLANTQQQYGIDPLVFGLLYFGSIPLFIASSAWLVRNIRAKKPVILPAALSILFWTAAYIYIVATGTNIPAWVYMIIAAVAATAIGSAWAAMSHHIPKISRRRLPRRKGR
jgi:hypothetical protein